MDRQAVMLVFNLSQVRQNSHAAPFGIKETPSTVFKIGSGTPWLRPPPLSRGRDEPGSQREPLAPQGNLGTRQGAGEALNVAFLCTKNGISFHPDHERRRPGRCLEEHLQPVQLR